MACSNFIIYLSNYYMYPERIMEGQTDYIGERQLKEMLRKGKMVLWTRPEV